MKVDLRITGGHVIDPLQDLDQVTDVLVLNGKIAVPKDGEEVVATQDIDASGLIVTPGLIDFHAHFFGCGSDLCIPADPSFLPSGVTAAVDPGSSGTANFELFAASMLMQRVRYKAFMHVCPTGLGTTQFHEEIKPDAWDRPKMKYLFEKHKDVLIGLKIRNSKGLVGPVGLDFVKRTIEVADEIGVPVCVHVTDGPTPVEDLLGVLRPGDIFCHVFHGTGETILDSGRVKHAVKEARSRGIVFDAANGSNHFAFSTAEAALEDGFFPDVISSDLTVKTLFKPPVYSLPYTLSKYLALGCKLPEVIAAATCKPAGLMGLQGKIGTLSAGAYADIAIFHMDINLVTFRDTLKQTRQGNRMLLPYMTILNGQIVFRDLRFLN